MKLIKNIGSKILFRLDRKLKALPQNYLQILAVLLVVFLAVMSVLIGFQAITKKAAILPVQHISFPKYMAADLKSIKVSRLKRAYEQALQFKLFMDSLAVNEPLKRDSLLKLRPGLLDSATLLIRLYEHNNATN